MDTTGGSGMVTGQELERLYRDVRWGAVHLANRAFVHELVGKTALGQLDGETRRKAHMRVHYEERPSSHGSAPPPATEAGAGRARATRLGVQQNRGVPRSSASKAHAYPSKSESVRRADRSRRLRHVASVRDQSDPEPRQRLVVKARGLDVGEATDLVGDDPLCYVSLVFTQPAPSRRTSGADDGRIDPSGPSAWGTRRPYRGAPC
jgi:hypothetical protein